MIEDKLNQRIHLEALAQSIQANAPSRVSTEKLLDDAARLETWILGGKR